MPDDISLGCVGMLQDRRQMLFYAGGGLGTVIFWTIDRGAMVEAAGPQILGNTQTLEQDPDVMPRLLLICMVYVPAVGFKQETLSGIDFYTAGYVCQDLIVRTGRRRIRDITFPGKHIMEDIFIPDIWTKRI